jgi:hypothetical protein
MDEASPDREDHLAERLVRLVVLVLFLKAAGLLVAFVLGASRSASGRGLVVALVLAAAMVGVAFGLLRAQRWAWPVAFAVLVADAVLVAGLLRWFIDIGLALVLFQPRVRARFGIR